MIGRIGKTLRGEAGNAMFIVMIGVVLFAALMYTFSRGARQGGGKMTEKRTEIAVAELLGFSQKIERGVTRILRTATSETDISFDNSFASAANPNCTTNKCKVFKPEGGALLWQNTPEGINAGAGWLFNGNNTIKGVGCDTAAANCTDLIALLTGITLTACNEINKQLGIIGSAPPEDSNNNIDESSPFTGDFTHAETLAVTGGALDGKYAGCFEEAPGTYYFYQVVYAR